MSHRYLKQHVVFVLKGLSTNFSHEVQFNCLEYYTVCKNRCVMSSLALEGAFQCKKKTKP